MFKVMMIIDGGHYFYGRWDDRNKANEIAMIVREERGCETYVEEEQSSSIFSCCGANQIFACLPGRMGRTFVRLPGRQPNICFVQYYYLTFEAIYDILYMSRGQGTGQI